MLKTSGGVCAPQGFWANGICAGIRANHTEKEDLMLLVSDGPCAAAAVYTQNLVQGAPLLVTKEHLQNGRAQAVICNSGNANTCNADGVKVARAMCALVREHTGIPSADVIVASTGVIGQPLPLESIEHGMAALAAGLGHSSTSAVRAIMTTDTVPKETAVAFALGNKPCKLGGMAKGSGMIHPNMATMLAFLTTDVAIAPDLLAQALRVAVDGTLNMITVDGDTSTNDMCCILANGLAGNAEITQAGEDYDAFCAALRSVLTDLAKLLAGDGEGATKLLECHVTGARDDENAKIAAKAVVSSSLFKAAMFGADANWGRVLCALGYSGAALDVTKVSVDFASAAGNINVCKNGAGVPFSEAQAKQVLGEKEITIAIGLGDGGAEATAWGCDLTCDYVKINGDYRT
jgi:glutamate N-acetyltransferase/amino-acid N-acetyltransferase